MSASSPVRKILLIGSLLLVVAVIVLVVQFTRHGSSVPQPGSDAYRQIVSAFFIGTVALEVDDLDRAELGLKQATELVPVEPAAWANLALLYMRRNDMTQAAPALDKAEQLAPKNAHIQTLQGILTSSKGDFAGAAARFRKASELDPKNIRPIFALAREIERQASPTSDADARKEYERAAALAPDNLAIRMELMRLAARTGDVAALRDLVAKTAPASKTWPPEIAERFTAVEAAANSDSTRAATTPVAFLTNMLKQLDQYRNDQAAVESATEAVADPIPQMLVVQNPSDQPAPADTALTFSAEPLSPGSTERADVVRAVYLTADAGPTVYAANAEALWPVSATGQRHPFPGNGTPPSPHGVTSTDFNYDFRTDIVLAGAGGVRLLQQNESGGFDDVTAKANLPQEILTGDYYGAWPADFDQEGDVDLVLARRAGTVLVLRNNGDGTFTPVEPFPAEATHIRACVWADIDSDGDADFAFVDADRELRLAINERGGKWSNSLPRSSATDIAFQVPLGDLRVDFGLLLDNPITSDFDNNGAGEIVTSGKDGPRLEIGTSTISLPAAAITDAADMNGDGRVDLLGVDNGGQPVRLLNKGTRNYHWQLVRLRAKDVPGDGRINSLGIGSEVELRAGMMYQKKLATGGPVHFGLGENAKADLIRITWPNGTNQGEFDLPPDKLFVAEQRLKGSCPFLFAWDGERVGFITDILWRSPLGLRINAVDTAQIQQTEDWVKVEGSELKPRDGVYDLRVTADLWETHFFDHVGLLVVDHPEGTEAIVDERFARVSPELKVHLTGPLQPIEEAIDDAGWDVTDAVAAKDARYLDVGKGRFQGITQEHTLELKLPDTAPADHPLTLVCDGWVYPTDSSINVAIAHGKHDYPRGLSLEVPDGKGGWIKKLDGIGFPAGKTKTIRIPLDTGVRHLRLRTNLEVYWDRITWAEVRSDAQPRITRIPLASAELKYRGFQKLDRVDSTSPELPHYDVVEGLQPRWRNLIGYHTRFGDVRELLDGVDDRYVIMNAGDEMRLMFAEAAAPRPGLVRSYVFISDGWEKDGDLNTQFGQTVLPLPRHGWTTYDQMWPLEQDPAYQKNPDDWVNYHTRYVVDGYAALLRR